MITRNAVLQARLATKRLLRELSVSNVNELKGSFIDVQRSNLFYYNELLKKKTLRDITQDCVLHFVSNNNTYLYTNNKLYLINNNIGHLTVVSKDTLIYSNSSLNSESIELLKTAYNIKG